MLPTPNNLATSYHHHLIELFIGYQQSHSLFFSITVMDSYDRKYVSMQLRLFSDTLFLCCLIKSWLKLFLVMQKGSSLTLHAI